MFKHTLIAAFFLVPALGFAADNTTAPRGERGSYFKKADADGNGTLSRAETEKSTPRLAKKFDQIDANKDGQLSRDEMNAWTKAHKHAHKKKHKADRQARTAERFKRADTNVDGKISRAEAENSAPRLTKKFDAIDANKDGQLTQEELRTYREAKRGRKDKA